jgi:phosphinothricin acetyltransferase
MDIRDAMAADAAAISAIYNATVGTSTVAWTEEHESVGSRREWLEEQLRFGHPVLVAATEGEVLGFASYDDFRDSSKWPGYRFTVEHTIHVREDHHGVGVGSALLRELITRATRHGKHVMIGAIDGHNTGSIRFHERHGFAIVARLPETGFKFGRWLELVLMQRILAEP